MRIYRSLNSDFLEYTDLTGFRAMVAIGPSKKYVRWQLTENGKTG